MSSIIVIPGITVKLDGVLLPVDDARTLGEVRVQQRLSLPTVCVLTFYEPAGPMVGKGALLPGTCLDITVEGFSTPLFAGQVTAVDYEYGPAKNLMIHVRAYDFLHRLRKRQPVAAHVQLNTVELARTLVADLGLTVEAVDCGPLRQYLIQYNQSDFDLLADVAERSGLYFTLQGDRLKFITLEGFSDTVPLVLGSSLLEARIEMNTDTICRRVETTGWDPHRVEPHSGRADRPRNGRRIAAGVSPDKVGTSGECIIVDALVQDDHQAEGIAQAELDRRVAREVVLWGVAEGDTRLQAGVPVEISGVAKSLEGRYVLTGVTHVINRTRGFVSEIDTSPPVPPARSRATVTTWGVVSRVEDPEGMGRVRVVLPNYGQIETQWLHVVIPGAGPDKGIVALPDVDDQVLVLLINEDPAQAVVIGGLYGINGPRDDGVDDGEVRRYTFTTPCGQLIKLDDGEKTVRIENSHGDFIRLSPDEVCVGDQRGSRIELTSGKCRIHSETDLEIEAPDKTITISGRKINFEKT